jgi:hypothetical protein
VTIVDTQGAVVASTCLAEVSCVAEPGLQQRLQSDVLWIDPPRKAAAAAEWRLQFGRTLEAADGSLAGAGPKSA